MSSSDYRLNKQQMAEVMKFGHFVSSPTLSAKVLAETRPDRRYGVVVSGKKVKRAVDRNLLKRRGRAVLSRLYPQFIPGVWLALFLGPQNLKTDFSVFQAEIEFLLKKAKII